MQRSAAAAVSNAAATTVSLHWRSLHQCD